MAKPFVINVFTVVQDYNILPLALVVLQGCTVRDVMQAVERGVKPRVKLMETPDVVSW